MSRLYYLFAILLFASIVSSTVDLEQYVYKPDSNYGYTLNRVIRGDGYNRYVLNFTAGKWLNSELVSNPVWWHFFEICIPDVVLSQTAFLWNDNGNYNTAANATIDPLIDNLCRKTNSVVAALHQNPNQPLKFANGTTAFMSEDAIVAYTWRQFFANHTNKEWIASYPMVRAVVKSIDALQDFVKDVSYIRIQDVVVGGASKRAWAAWLAAAIEPRVKAVVPVVLPIVNMEVNINNHFRSYGGWSYAFYNYFVEGLMASLNQQNFHVLANEIDPLFYVAQLVKPKYVVTAVSDQFFIPDSSVYFFDKLVGKKHQRIVPNDDHYMKLKYDQVVTDVTAYYKTLIYNQPLPEFEWSVVPNLSNNRTSITVVLKGNGYLLPQKPSSVVLWSARSASATKRDWRIYTCPTCPQNVTFVATPVSETSTKGIYTAFLDAPVSGWNGGFVELTFDNIFTGTQKYTTEFFWAPYTFPFESCGNKCQNVPFPA